MRHRVVRFERNLVGRDFVVGDIHGCYDLLMDKLKEVAFDFDKDRLFSVGDLVDRGPDSFKVAMLVGEKWFHAVRGNHEQMAIGVAAGRHNIANYAMNGGKWFLLLSDEERAVVANVLDTLPLAIEVQTERGRVGIVHADIEGDDWDQWVELLTTANSNNKLTDLKEQAMWSRDRIRHMDRTGVTGVAVMYVGHTPVKEITELGNVAYIDTGAVFGCDLTMVQL